MFPPKDASTLLATLLPAALGAQVSPVWQDFVDAQANGTVATLPDFSRAGYEYSEVPLPNVTWDVFDVTDYGAVADDGISDRDAIQDAIVAAEANGSGVVFFPPGRFHLNTTADVGSTIRIRSGQIVLRGSGFGPGGTELFMERNFEPEDPSLLYSTPYMIRIQPDDTGEGTITTITANAERNSHEVQVASTSNLYVGRVVTLYLKDPNAVPAFLAPYTADAAWTRLFSDGIQVRERHEITAITGNTVTFREPLLTDIDATYAWQVRQHKYIEQVGIEDIAFTGNWHEEFVHHLNALHDGGWSALEIFNVRNGWIRRCRFKDWNYGIYQDNCTAFTIMHTILEGNPGHHAYHTRRSYGVLVALSDDRASHWHGPGMGYQSAGTVYWRHRYNSDTSWDSHSSTPYATLLDAVEGGMKYGRSGGTLEGMPNHLRHFVLWNFQHTGTAVTDYDFWRTDPNNRDRYLNPIIVGFHGSDSTFVTSHLELLESLGSAVEPESLFEAQLALRHGAVPAWLENAKVEWDLLRDGGDGLLASPAANSVHAPYESIALELALPSGTPPLISQVRYEENGSAPIVETASVPFASAWTSVPPGTYSVSAQLDMASGWKLGTNSAVVYVGYLPQPEIIPAAVSASGAQSPNDPENVLDGDLGTRWSAEGDGEWIAFDLGSVKEVNRIDVSWYQGDARTSSFDIDLSDDGTTWRPALSTWSSLGTELQTNYFTGGPARHVRLTGHGNTVNAWNSITEVELFAPVASNTAAMGDWAIF